METKSAQIASLDGMPKKQQKKVLKRMVSEVMKDRRYRRAIRKNPERISKKTSKAAATAAVDAVLGVKTGKPAVPPKKTALDIYSGFAKSLAGSLRKYNAKRKKTLKKQGLNEKTGLIPLKKLKAAPKAKLNKAYKPKKSK